MIKIGLVLLFISIPCLAYVPTVESLFRHSSNPDVTSSGISLNLVVKKMNSASKASESSESSLLAGTKSEDFYKIFFTKINRESMKVAQVRYETATFNDSTLLERKYFPSFSAYTLKGSTEDIEKGLFYSMLRSILFNDGAFIVNYLKSAGVGVKLNNEIINRQKVELLASYKQYLISINKDRTNKKTEQNPLRPSDAASREKVDFIMNAPMYVDQNQVKLSRDNGEIAWLIAAGPFEAVVSYKQREIQRIRYKTQIGEYEIICKDYWAPNGTHSVPRYLIVKDYRGESYKVEISGLRHYGDKDADVANRLKKWDDVLKGRESYTPKPAFLL